MRSRSWTTVLCAWLASTSACGGVVTPAASTTEGGSSGPSDPTTSGPTPSPETTAAPDPSTTGAPGSSSSGSAPEGGESMGFLFDVGGGMATGTTDGTTGVEPLDYDCDDLTTPFIAEMQIAGAKGYHDVFFDDLGHIIGYDFNSLVQVTYDGDVSVFLPGVNGAQGMDVLANGDLLYLNDNGELRRVTPDLQVSVVASGMYGGYGVTVGPDQLAYACHSGGVTRIDPESGDTSTFLTLPGATPRAIVFNLDSTGVYMSTLLAPGSPVYFSAVDDDLDPVDDPYVFANNVGLGYHDGLGIDACGNLYVPDYSSSGLYRVDPEGTVTTVYSGGGAGQPHYGHGLEWGSGIGGWQDHAIYLPQPYNGLSVNEVLLGVPSGSTVRTWR